MSELSRRAPRDRGIAPAFGSLAAGYQYRPMYRMTRRRVAPGSRVLDWGTGSGHFSFFLREAGYEPTGFQHDGGLQAAEWLGNPYQSFVEGDLADPVTLPFADGSFDAIASVGVLEHVRESGGTESASLAEIVRILRPGGVMVCCHLPNQWSWIEALADLIPGKHHHEYRYGRADIERLVSQAGLELLEVSRYGVLPRNVTGRLPLIVRRSRVFARAFDLLDAILLVVLAPISQNWAFAARRPVGQTPGRTTGRPTARAAAASRSS